MRSSLVPCYEFDDLVAELGVQPLSDRKPGTGWHKVDWVNEWGTVLQSYIYYDRDFPMECIHLDLR